MTAPERSRFSPQVKAEFAKKLKEAVARLRHDFEVLPLRQQIEYMLQAPYSLNVPVVRALRAKEPFQSLVGYTISDISIWPALLNSSDPTMSSRDPNDPVFLNLLEVMLLKLATQLELLSRIEDEEKLLEELFTFLEMSEVERRVTIPLLNVNMRPDSVAIAGFGELRKVPDQIVELSFSVKTGHFILAASLFPLWDEIRKRVTLLRISAYPLAAYNHFSVQSFEPWEMPLADSKFSIRFSGEPVSKPRMASVMLDTEHIAEIEPLLQSMAQFKWDKATPWRLAADRLDDAVFKLQCGSPDAILDIVIGLEAILTESESRQESTHKVAVRAARYLEETVQGRRDIFRLVNRHTRRAPRWRTERCGSEPRTASATSIRRHEFWHDC